MVGGVTPSTWNFGSERPSWSEIADFQLLFARTASAVLYLAKKEQLTLIKMSLRWSSYVAPKSPKGGSKTQNGRFRYRVAICLKKVCYKVYLCENCRRRSCKAFTGLTISAKMNGGVTPSTWNFESYWPRWSEIADFRSIFSCSASAVTPSEKSWINTNRKSTTCFLMSSRWTLYFVPKPPKGVQNAKCPKFEQ